MRRILFILLLFSSTLFSQYYVWEMYPRPDVQNDSFDVSGHFMTYKTVGNETIYSSPIPLSRWTGSWSTSMKFDSLSGTTNFKIYVQMLMPDDKWYDVPDITWQTLDGDSTATSFSGSNQDTYYHFSTPYSSPYWSQLIYNQIRFKIVFTGAQRIKLWHTLLYDREY